MARGHIVVIDGLRAMLRVENGKVTQAWIDDSLEPMAVEVIQTDASGDKWTTIWTEETTASDKVSEVIETAMHTEWPRWD